MRRRSTEQARRRLALRRETVRKLSNLDLGRVAGGTEAGTWGCPTDTDGCDTTECWLSTVSRFC